MISSADYCLSELGLLTVARFSLGRPRYRHWKVFGVFSLAAFAMVAVGLFAEHWYDAKYKDDGLEAVLIEATSALTGIGLLLLLGVAAGNYRKDRQLRPTHSLEGVSRK